MNILALDLGKYRTVFCAYNSEKGDRDFGKINTIPQDMHDKFIDGKSPNNNTMHLFLISYQQFSIDQGNWSPAFVVTLL